MDLPIVEVAGSPRAMGEQFGEATREQARELYDIRVRAAIAFAAMNSRRRFTAQEVLDLCEPSVNITRWWDPIGFEEFEGIARALDLTLAQTYALMGLTDLRDRLAFATLGTNGDEDAGSEGCSSFIVARDRGERGRLYLGQNWDLRTDNMPFVRLVHRTPDDGPETWSLTTTGCLSLIGMNSEGVAVGNTNLRTSDARAGVQYLSLIHRALRCTSAREAVDVIADAPRAGAHHYYLADRSGTGFGLQCSATQHATSVVDHGTYTLCNHIVDPTVAACEMPSPTDSTHERYSRMQALLADNGSIGVVRLKAILSDHEGGEQAICRHDVGVGISTNACVIMSPDTGELHACRGQPHFGSWVTRRF